MKKIISLLISVLLLIGTSTAAFAVELKDAYDGSKVTLSGIAVDGALANQLVTVLVLKPNADGTEADISNVLNAPNSSAYLSALEYVGIVTLNGNAAFPQDYIVPLKESLPSGLCAVYVNFIGQNDLVKLGVFNHVNAGQLNALIASFNSPTADYASILTPSNIDFLINIGIDNEGYAALGDKSSFYAKLKAFAPFEDGKLGPNSTAALHLSASFNQAVALAHLAESADTLGTLGTYNGKFWNVDIDADDDFIKLDETGAIQASILNTIKTTPFANGDVLSETFKRLTGIEVLKNKVSLKGDVDAFLNNYWDTFDFDLSLYNSASLTDYDKADIQTYILSNKSNKSTYEGIKQLYIDAINSLGSGSVSGSGSSDNSGGSNRRPSGGSPVVSVTPDLENDIKAIPFNDVPSDHWSFSYVSRLYKENIVTGKSENSFNPSDSITREEFVKIVVEALDLPLVGFSSFDDVKSGAWYLPYVNAAVNAGIINGKSEKVFGVGDKISRQDAAVIISRAANLTADDTLTFSDKSNISDYAVKAIAAMVNEGIITGYEDKSFKPRNEISRAESCAVICRLLDKRGGLR